jgi:two-component SAPR family response regulator
MKLKGEFLQVNFVSSDSVLIERIKFHNSRNRICNIEYSEKPLENSQDIYIIPATEIPNLPVNIIRINKRLPVIAYGSRFYLEKAFYAGCMDYLKEPWDPEELFLRLGRIINEIDERCSNIISEIKEKALDMGIEFSYHEEKILKILLKNKEEAVSRDALIALLSNKNLSFDTTRTVDMHISKIRKKLKQLKINEDILSVRGTGYKISHYNK